MLRREVGGAWGAWSPRCVGNGSGPGPSETWHVVTWNGSGDRKSYLHPKIKKKKQDIIRKLILSATFKIISVVLFFLIFFYLSKCIIKYYTFKKNYFKIKNF